MNWSVTKVIGQNVRARRDELGMTAASLGESIGEIFDKPWPRQTVYMMENGERAMTANDLVAVAHVLQTTPAQLLAPPIEAKVVHVGNLMVGREMLLGLPPNLIATPGATVDLLRDLMDEVRQAWTAAGRAQEILQEDVTRGLKAIDDRIAAHVAGSEKGVSDGQSK